MPTLKRRWTVADLEDLPDDGNRYEVIDGELLVTPSPALRHQVAVGELYARLRDYLLRERVGHAFVAPGDITFSLTRRVQPDVFVVPLVDGRLPDCWADVHRLLLAVEVLSPSTVRADRVHKRTLYREEDVREYWIVDLDARTIERSTPEDRRVDVIADELSWQPDGAEEAFVIGVPQFFAAVLDPGC
ncbi:MAG: Uma2 family endonuclease [Gemmatimonadaceae bacterium]